MKTIDADERRARIGPRHYLSVEGDSVPAVAAALVGIHSSDPATVFLSIRARIPGVKVDDVENSLYEQRTVARLLGMRKTLFVVPNDLAPVLQQACAAAYLDSEKKRIARLLEEQDVTADGRRWLADASHAVLEALADGPATAKELSGRIPDLTETLEFGRGTKWGGKVGMSTRVLFLLATAGQIIRTRPLGSWVSGQYRWARTDDWLGDIPAPDEDRAAAELVSRWLASYGPGTDTDLKWWTGWTKTRLRRALADAGAVAVDLDGSQAWDHPGARTPGAQKWVKLLPSLDSTVMGWKERSWYLGSHEQVLFDRNGNAGPTVWVDGRVVGGWAQTPDRTVRFELLERVDSETSDRIEAEADALTEWFGEVRVSPRFPSPLSKQLAAG